ncbi:MAG: DUF4954 family protein [Candidatus Marinimicrobia bacterium]|nr:DUF4954 family protein [Candidatus Neomarinimicrobiota bacterium]
MDEDEYRKLKTCEIEVLQDNGCNARDWDKIEVHEKFDPKRIADVHFSGHIKLGYFDDTVTLTGGICYKTGIYKTTLHNCVIGNNVLIEHVDNYIANYQIGDDVIIKNVDIIATDLETSFGNGVQVEPLNEGGGRQFSIYEKLSAQLAYILTTFRHNPKMIEKCRKMITSYAEEYIGKPGRIGSNTRIMNSDTIKNLQCGEYAIIEGAKRLDNGTITSTKQAPVKLQQGIVAEDFIISTGSTLKDDVIISETFVGQGVKMGRQFSSENSVFFANCEGYHGEACSIFAGPFTVSHHKSTLLIAGMFSFCNAGSGSNQSNHMYKLGPNHQGVIERGSKTASDSYMLYPMKVGPFSLIMGRHYQNSDTSNLPFSYLFEGDNESLIIPGVNLTSVGTIRDARKWPNRDRRKCKKKLDLINFFLLSPFTVQKMINGKQILKNLKKTTGVTSDFYYYNNVKIKRGSLERGIKYYDIGITKYIGNCVVRRLEESDFNNKDEFYEIMKANSTVGQGSWLDISGMIAPEEKILELVEKIENGRLQDLESIEDEFSNIHDNFFEYEWNWAVKMIEEMLGKAITSISISEFIELIEDWKDNVVKLDNILKDDAAKEFSRKTQVGYGYNGDDQVREQDFANVIGTFEENQFVGMIDDHIDRKIRKSEDVIASLNQIQ